MGRERFRSSLSVDRLVAPLASVMAYRSDLQDELLDVRRMFEPAVARVAALRATEEDLADLQRILEAQRQKLKNRPIGHRAKTRRFMPFWRGPRAIAWS